MAESREHRDHLRHALTLEPLGYGVLLVDPSILEAMIGALFIGGLLSHVRACTRAEGQIDRSSGQRRTFCGPIRIPFRASVVSIVDGFAPGP